MLRKGDLELLAGEDQPLLVGRDTLLVLDLGLHVLDGVRALNLEGDRLACEGLHEDLHMAGGGRYYLVLGLLASCLLWWRAFCRLRAAAAAFA